MNPIYIFGSIKKLHVQPRNNQKKKQNFHHLHFNVKNGSKQIKFQFRQRHEKTRNIEFNNKLLIPNFRDVNQILYFTTKFELSEMFNFTTPFVSS